MILAKEFIKNIGVSELYNLSWIDDLTGELKSGRLNTILSFINEGISALYDKFLLKKEQIYLFPYPGRFVYEISSEHMMSNSLSPDYNHYLWKGLNKTFENNLVKIINIFNSDGHELSLNDPTDPFTVNIPFFNVIQLSNFEKDWKLSITYTASPPKIKTTDDKINLPPVLIPVLTSYVAYKAYNIINTPESAQIAVKYYQMYLSQINELIQQDSVHNTFADNPIKFIKRGWR